MSFLHRRTAVLPHERVPPLTGSAAKRVMKELTKWDKEKGDGMNLVQQADILSVLFIDLQIKGNPVYPEDQTYRLQYIIDKEYPFKQPQVQFISKDPYSATTYAIPLHPHVYSNGHICLNILYDGWAPTHTLLSVALSIQSMLSGNSEASRPAGDSEYCKRAPTNPLQSSWVFDDDSV